MKEIGRGLTEGYTQILDKRIFDSKVSCTNSYKVCRTIANYLEKIVGKENLEKYYFESDLKALINHLEKYDNKDKIINFIYDVDYILRYYNYAYGKIIDYLPKFKKLIDNELNKVNLYLKKLYYNKLKSENNLDLEDEYGSFESKIDNEENLKPKKYFTKKYDRFIELLFK